MKRGGFLKRNTPLRARAPLRAKTGLKARSTLNSTGTLKRNTRLRPVGKSETAETKRDIQSLLRENAILRDGGCILRHYPEAGACGGRRKDGTLILQAEHLITRSNSATYGDMRNIVCLCAHHHGNWKPQYSRLYWELIEREIGETRWQWLKLAEADKRPHKMDWALVKVALEQELRSHRNRESVISRIAWTNPE